MKNIEVVSLIKSTLLTTGKGIEGDPIRTVIQYYNFDGSVLFEYDTFTKESRYYSESEYKCKSNYEYYNL